MASILRYVQPTNRSNHLATLDMDGSAEDAGETKSHVYPRRFESSLEPDSSSAMLVGGVKFVRCFVLASGIFASSSCFEFNP